VRAGAVRDGLRLSVGTLTVVPVPAPLVLDRTCAAVAMTAAVLPGAATGLAVGALLVALAGLGVPALLSSLLAVGAGALLTRFLHVDGLADTTDGLVASWDRDRALEVMRTGDVGPCGATALLVVLGGQAAALSALVPAGHRPGPALAAVVLAWTASRSVLAVLTARGTTAARPDGLGAGVLGAVPVPVAVAVPVGVAALGWAAAGPSGPLAVGGAVLAAGVLARHAHRRLGGLTGDVLGAGVEVALLAGLVVLSAG